MRYIVIIISVFISMSVVTSGVFKTHLLQSNESDISVTKKKTKIVRVDTDSLMVFYPNFSKVDLSCGKMPSKKDKSVIFVAAAAYTGECLSKFNHSNIAGDHVSDGIRYDGYECDRNTGLFVYYNDKWKFCNEPYDYELDSAAMYNGAAFAQELIMQNGKIMNTIRKDTGVNYYRALCSHNDKLCVIESIVFISFGDFKRLLIDYGVSDAIYLDGGPGWSHAWYRGDSGVIDIWPKSHDYCTNWITFYK